MSFIKYTGLSALVLTVAVGCATAPTAQEEGMEEQTSAEMQEKKAAAREAIDAAKAAMEEAKAAGALWRDTGDIIKKAEEAYADGDYGAAQRLAQMARRQAENALEQKQREDARLSKQMQMKVAKESGMDQYVVRRGDNLWDISGKSEIYGNPYQWPMIYKANRDKIRDADLIYPGQEFAIDRDYSMGEKNAAIEHAKTRGSWSLGVVEQSDRNYLSR